MGGPLRPLGGPLGGARRRPLMSPLPWALRRLLPGPPLRARRRQQRRGHAAAFSSSSSSSPPLLGGRAWWRLRRPLLLCVRPRGAHALCPRREHVGEPRGGAAGQRAVGDGAGQPLLHPAEEEGARRRWRRRGTGG